MFIPLGALLAGLSVIAGAFGAHALEDALPADLLDVFETAARYHMYHSLGLIAAGLVAARGGGGLARGAGWLFIAGILIFSGSLYLLSLTGARWLGAITPIGGVAFIGGWLALAWSARSLPSS